MSSDSSPILQATINSGKEQYDSLYNAKQKGVTAVARVSVVGAVATSLMFIVKKATDNPTVVATLMGGVTLIPGFGQGIIVVFALIGVAFFAMKLVRERLAKYKSALRAIDEFTILLHKIQKIANLTIFISTTYNFDINIDEVLEQLKIIFSRFDEVLNENPKNYDEIQKNIMTITSSPDFQQEADKALVNKAEDQQGPGPGQGPGQGTGKTVDTVKQESVGGNSIQRGGLWRELTFKPDVWTNIIEKDIIKLNIYLSTTMSEFSIILNVIQMNLIVDGLGPDEVKKSAAIKSLMTKNGLIQSSKEYSQTRIGILLHEILKLRTDFNYCKSAKRSRMDKFFSVKEDPICSENNESEDAIAGNIPFTKYRKDLHHHIEQIIIRLKNGDYSKEMKKSVCDNVLRPYVDMLQTCKLVVDSAVPVPREVIIAYKLESMTLDEKNLINGELDTLIKKLNTDIASISPPPQSGGGAFGFSNPFKRTPETLTPEQKPDFEKVRQPYVDRIKNESYLLTTDTQISEFLMKVYEYTRKVGKTSPEDIKKQLAAAEELIDKPAPAPEQTPAQTPGEVVSGTQQQQQQQPERQQPAQPPAPAQTPEQQQQQQQQQQPQLEQAKKGGQKSRGRNSRRRVTRKKTKRHGSKTYKVFV